jgi:hypothetical protein
LKTLQNKVVSKCKNNKIKGEKDKKTLKTQELKKTWKVFMGLGVADVSKECMQAEKETVE